MMRLFHSAACCLLIFTAAAQSQTPDSEGVGSVLTALNDPVMRGSVFAENAEGRLQLEGLLGARVYPLDAVRAVPRDGAPAPLSAPGVIFYEPSAEPQTIVLPVAPAGRRLWISSAGSPSGARPPHIWSREIHFVTPDVAVVDAVVDHPATGFANFQTVDGQSAERGQSVVRRAESADVVLVMVKQEGDWRISVVRQAQR